MSRPYYQDDFVRLYHGDAHGQLPDILEPCAIVTDPPWGTGWVRGGGKVGEFKAKHEKPAWDVWSTGWLSYAGFVKAGAVFSPLSRRAGSPTLDS